MRKLTRRTLTAVIGAGLAVTAVTDIVVAAPNALNDWPYASTAAASGPSPATLVAVGDIACEPNTTENNSTPSKFKCGSPALGGYDAEYATVAQAEADQPDAVAILGDEQYEVGKYSDFENSFDKTWGALKFLERPAPGNHEYYAYKDGESAQNGAGYFSYFNGTDASAAPRPQGQAGDDTDAVHGWYSYNLGNWHVISLNIECNSTAFGNDCSTTDGDLLTKETQWLAADLQADKSKCTLAYWHQPTFSSTTSGTAAVASAPGAGGQEGGVADAWWKLLYASHADLVLNGHEHVYARMRPMDPAGSYDAKNGIPEFIIGTGGEALDSLARNADGSFANPNVVTGQDAAYGVSKLTLGQNGYSWDYHPSYAPSGAPADALSYSDTGSASCHAARS